MRQFVLPRDWDGSRSCDLAGERARYLRDVLRLGPGDRFPGIDRAGKRYDLEITTATRDRVRIAVKPAAGTGGFRDVHAGATSVRPLPEPRELPDPGPIVPLTLIQCLPRGTKMDIIVRQAVEAGVGRIIPLVSSRSLHPGGQGTQRGNRWDRIAREAVQQCGSAFVPTVEAVCGFGDLVSVLGPVSGDSLRLFLHESPLASGTIHRYCTVPPVSVAVCVGPEGGFSSEETGLLDSLGFRPVWLGPNVLRTETASIFAIGALRMILLERSSWIPSE
ncbi:MAG: 16S rRNA (uracil(1498)-N(3))-methyltransferase [Spirochaetes bacterium]|nr:16S rRNA (uracil(1498)-N(3))-methyltransferase [Spirochaetota bacterium]